jgi:hypothetical protein
MSLITAHAFTAAVKTPRAAKLGHFRHDTA